MTRMNSFYLFASLPTELRLKIYEHIEQNCTFSDDPTSPDNFHNLHILKISYSPSLSRYISNTAPPITLSICRESREQTLLSWDHLSLGPAITHSEPKSFTNTSVSLPFRAISTYHHHLHLHSLTPPSPSHMQSSTEPSTASSTNSSSHQQQQLKTLPIPIRYPDTILYISSLSLLLRTIHFQHTFLFHLSTSPSRHLIQWLAIDLRVWNELCEHGFLGVLGRMRGLKGVRLVVEFGRSFTGPLGFLPSPSWRTDLNYLAKQAARDIERIRSGFRHRNRSKNTPLTSSTACASTRSNDELGGVDVQCVILTRGGEHA